MEKITVIEKVSLIERLYTGKSAVNLNLLEKTQKQKLIKSVVDFLSAVYEKSSKDSEGLITSYNLNLDNKDVFKNMCYEVKLALDLPNNFMIKENMLKMATMQAMDYKLLWNKKRGDDSAKIADYSTKAVSKFLTKIAIFVHNKITKKDIIKGE